MIISDTTQQIDQIIDFYLRTLLEDVVPFWFPRSIDLEFGGYLHCLDADGSLVDTDKSAWAQGRMAWMLLTMFNTVEAHPDWLCWGQSGVDFLMRHGSDDDGHMFFHLTRDGRPIRKRRYAYSESFASIACAALFRATGNEQWRDKSIELFEHFLRWNFTPGVMLAKFCDTRPMISIGPRMIAITTAQSLRDDLGTSQICQQWIDRCIEEIETFFVKHDRQVVMENVAEDGTILDHFDGRTINPGHAMEAAWFILDEARIHDDSQLLELGTKMLQYSWHRGWDQEFGGLFYFRDVDHRPVQEYWHDMKFWWPHNEAVIATWMAFLLTGQPEYAQWHCQVHNWSFQHFSDPKHGEWFGYLHRDGRLSNTLKGNIWKSFFHYPRMLWKCSQLRKQLQASSSDS
jgi:N-acylglucosamine 2-epimerase